MKSYISHIMIAAVLLSAVPAFSAGESDTRRMIELVNDYWISEHSSAPGYSWDNAAYYVGNNEAYFTTGIEAYKDYSVKWAEHNAWKGHGEKDSSKWSNSNVYHADNQTCFQVYADFYNVDGDYSKISRAIEVVGTQATTDKVDYWWWCDALFMAMPVFTKLYRITGDEKYSDKLYEYFVWTRDLLYDSESRLFFRDKSFVNSKIGGNKNFWARGNGWVFAGLSMVLRDMPENWKYRDYFLSVYLDMADGIASCQKLDSEGNGFWTQSMLANYPLSSDNPEGYETSGTAFMTYGLLYGINAGLLTEQRYIDAAMRGVSYIKNVAVNDEGLVGYCQEIGSAATKATAKGTTQNFGVGAVLLALCELYRYEGAMTNDLQPYVQRRLNNTVVLKRGGNYVFSGGEVKPTDCSAFYTMTGTLYVPLRAVAEGLGFRVGWNNGETVMSNSLLSAKVTKGSNLVYVDGVPVEMSANVITANSRTCVPLDFFELALGKNVEITTLVDSEGLSSALIYIGYKEDNFLPSESAAERLLLGALFAGDFPVREAQGERKLGANIPELANPKRIPIVSASAKQIPEPENPPTNAFDGDISTRYAATDFDAVFDLGSVKYVDKLLLSFWKYNERTTSFAVSVSSDGLNYTQLFSGNTVMGERFVEASAARDVRYVRVEGFGNSINNWTSLLEIVPLGK